MMDARSESFLLHVHQDLAKVLRAASQSTPFEICYGLRSWEAEAEAVHTGHSHTMHSRHLPSNNPAYKNLSCAVDVAHLTPASGQIDWAPGHEATVFGAIAGAVLFAAHSLSIHIEWGGSWNETSILEASTPANPHPFHDFGHFQLPWKVYP